MADYNYALRITNYAFYPHALEAKNSAADYTPNIHHTCTPPVVEDGRA